LLTTLREADEVLHVLADGCDVERPLHAERAGEGSTLVSECDTGQVGVHGGASPRHATGVVDDEDAIGHDDA
jgi:hypothetical protein